MEVAHSFDDFARLTARDQLRGCGSHCTPLLTQQLGDGRHHHALDTGSRRAMASEIVGFDGAKDAFQPRAEEHGLDFALVGFAGFDQQDPLLLSQLQGFATPINSHNSVRNS